METVIKCEKIKEWNGKPIYGIGLSDGRGGESFQEIPKGTPVSDLLITPNANPTYADRIKWNKPGVSGGGYQGRQKSGNESFALSYAKDLGVAYINKGNNIAPEKIIEWADKFYGWLEAKKGASDLENKVGLASKLPDAKQPEPKSEDLPF